MDKCPICFSHEVYKFSNFFDDRYGYPGLFYMSRCKICDHKFIPIKSEKLSIEELYTDFYPRSTFNLEKYRPSKEIKGFRSWLNGKNRLAYSWVPKNVRILDIGCGFGETLGYHQARGCDVYGVEVDENIRRVAEKFHFNIHVGLFEPDIYDIGYFDYVTMDQVIEHVTDPLETLREIARILKPGGLAILSTPNSNGWGAMVFGRRWINWHAPYHLHHFSIRSMKFATEKAGLMVEKIRTITSSEWLYYQWSHLVTYPAMGTPSGFWSPHHDLSLKQKVWMQILSIIHMSKINHLITRLFDTLGSGDNHLYILRKPL